MSFRERRPDRTGDFIRRASVRAGWGPVRARRAAVRARRASVRAAAALVLAAGLVLTPLMSMLLAPTTAGTAGIAHAASQLPVSIIMDGLPLPTDVPAQILGGRTMVPLRAIFDALGAEVAWDSATRTVTAHRGDRTVRLTAGDRTAVIDGTWVSLDAPPVIVGGRTLVPLRFVAEAFGADVAWDAASRTVTISSAGEGGHAAGIPAA